MAVMALWTAAVITKTAAAKQHKIIIKAVAGCTVGIIILIYYSMILILGAGLATALFLAFWISAA